MGIGRLAVVLLAVAVAVTGFAALVNEVASGDDSNPALEDIELRKDDAGSDEVVDDDGRDGDGDATHGDDGTSGGNNTGDGDRTAGDDGTSGGVSRGGDGTRGPQNTGDLDSTRGNDGTSGGDNSYVAPAPTPYYGGGGGSASGGSGGT